MLAKVVAAAVWWMELNNALFIAPQDDMKKRMNWTQNIWRNGWFGKIINHLVQITQNHSSSLSKSSIPFHSINPFLKNHPDSKSLAWHFNRNYSVPQPAATTFASVWFFFYDVHVLHPFKWCRQELEFPSSIHPFGLEFLEVPLTNSLETTWESASSSLSFLTFAK